MFDPRSILTKSRRSQTQKWIEVKSSASLLRIYTFVSWSSCNLLAKSDHYVNLKHFLCSRLINCGNWHADDPPWSLGSGNIVQERFKCGLKLSTQITTTSPLVRQLNSTALHRHRRGQGLDSPSLLFKYREKKCDDHPHSLTNAGVLHLVCNIHIGTFATRDLKRATQADWPISGGSFCYHFFCFGSI